jgi:hypothetical protein
MVKLLKFLFSCIYGAYYAAIVAGPLTMIVVIFSGGKIKMFSSGFYTTWAIIILILFLIYHLFIKQFSNDDEP